MSSTTLEKQPSEKNAIPPTLFRLLDVRSGITSVNAFPALLLSGASFGCTCRPTACAGLEEATRLLAQLRGLRAHAAHHLRSPGRCWGLCVAFEGGMIVEAPYSVPRQPNCLMMSNRTAMLLLRSVMGCGGKCITSPMATHATSSTFDGESAGKAWRETGEAS